jgi:hypothetical protein
MSTQEQLARSLADITSNLARYIDEQAQLIAKPKIQRAEREWERRMDETTEVHGARERRSADLITELRRRITALEKTEEKARLRELRVRAVADDLEARDLHEPARQIRNALNFVGHMANGGAR